MKACLERADFEKRGRLAGFPDDDPLMFREPSVVIDSRKIHGGEIFFALKGERTDGHHFVGQAFGKGAACAVVSGEWFDQERTEERIDNARYLVVDDTVAALQSLAGAYRMTFDIPLVGIGGSNGKTTTKEMTASVLGGCCNVHMSEGNLNNHLGVPLTLFGLRRDHEVAVVEMGINHPGEMELLCDIAGPTHGLLTNIGHEHLEYLVDLDGVTQAETALYRYLEQNSGIIFLNGGDRRLVEAADGCDSRVMYGIKHEDSSVWAEDIRIDGSGKALFRLSSHEESVMVSLSFAGRHNVSNAVAAAAVGLHFGLRPQDVARGLESLCPKSGWKRLEFQNAGGIIVVNDTYNANPDSMRHALDLLCELPAKGKRVAVLGDMLELGEGSVSEHRNIGRYAAGLEPLDILFTFGEEAASVCMAAGTKCSGSFMEEGALQEALDALLHPGDVLLLKASRGMRLERFAEALMKHATD